ncbi:MAG: hypothetical protein Q9M36_12125 [Sulfurovum sp.]|nr:hypothetical protein [Sulfurovum sp.]
MKHSLGKLLLYCMCVVLNAGDFDYTLEISKSNPYVKEALLLTLDVNQSNHDVVLFFDFDLLPSADYTFERSNIQEIDGYHNTQIRYSYLIYPLRKGRIEVNFYLLQKATTDESVAYSFSGDRDNVKTLETRDTFIAIKPLVLNVKPLAKGTQIVGDFKLDYRIKKHEALAYEPLPMQVTIEGIGYPPLLDGLLPKESLFQTFSQAPEVSVSTREQGRYAKVHYTMALSHDRNFSLAPIEIHAFNPRLEKYYSLHIPRQSFVIAEINHTALLDSINTPLAVEIEWSWLKEMLFALFYVAVGYTTAILLQGRRPNSTTQIPKPQRAILLAKLEGLSSIKVLLQWLMATDIIYFAENISRLESSLYTPNKIALKILKKEIREKIQCMNT